MKSKHLLLADPFSTGHHIEYATFVIDAAKDAGFKITLVCDSKMKDFFINRVDEVIVLTPDLNGNILYKEKEKYKYLKKIIDIAKDKNATSLHLLYLDRFIRALSLVNIKSQMSLFATCHWYYMLPEFSTSFSSYLASVLERYCVNRLVNKGWKIMGHSKSASEKLLGNSDYVLNYPVSKPELLDDLLIENYKNNLNIPSDAIIILCFGGTRRDKGADVAVNTLSKLDDKFHLIIAGKQEDIQYKTLESMAVKANCLSRLHLIEGFISDDDTTILFNMCHIVLVPYRKYFSGQSGPLTIAASLGKFIICTNVMILKETVNRFSLGMACEKNDLVGSINSITDTELSIDEIYTNTFNDAHASELFVSSIANLYLNGINYGNC